MKGMNIIIKTSFAFILGEPFDSTYPVLNYILRTAMKFFFHDNVKAMFLIV